jgi:chitinase
MVRFYFLIVSALFLFSSLHAVQHLEGVEYTKGWVSSLKFRVPKGTNVSQNPVHFDIDEGIKISNAWGLKEAPLTLSQHNNTVTIKVEQTWAHNEDLITKEDEIFSIQFNPSQADFTLSNVRWGSLEAECNQPLQKQIIQPAPVQEKPKENSFIVPQPSGKVLFSPYIDVTLNDVTQWSPSENSMQPELLPAILEKNGIPSVRLGFVTAKAGKCEPTFAGYDVASGYGKKIFKGLKEKGIKVIVSSGGAANTYLEQVSSSPAELAKAYGQVISAYDLYGLDLDVENGFESHHPGKLDQMMKALQIVEQDHPQLDVIFTLPVLPTGLVPGNGLGVLEKAIDSNLTFSVNIMAMDYGPGFSDKSMGQYAIDAAKSTFSQFKQTYEKKGLNISDAALWSRLHITPMIGMNDTAPQNFDLEDARLLKEFGESVGLGALSFWSLNRDHPGTGNSTNIVHSSSHPRTGPNQTKDWEYVRVFLGAKN